MVGGLSPNDRMLSQPGKGRSGKKWCCLMGTPVAQSVRGILVPLPGPSSELIDSHLRTAIAIMISILLMETIMIAIQWGWEQVWGAQGCGGYGLWLGFREKWHLD